MYGQYILHKVLGMASQLRYAICHFAIMISKFSFYKSLFSILLKINVFEHRNTYDFTKFWSNIYLMKRH